MVFVAPFSHPLLVNPLSATMAFVAYFDLGAEDADPAAGLLQAGLLQTFMAFMVAGIARMEPLDPKMHTQACVTV